MGENGKQVGPGGDRGDMIDCGEDCLKGTTVGNLIQLDDDGCAEGGDSNVVDGTDACAVPCDISDALIIPDTFDGDMSLSPSETIMV